MTVQEMSDLLKYSMCYGRHIASTAAGSKGAVTRRAILDAATDRFGREGYRATSVADIARDASVGGTVPYTYFADKETLFLAALDEDAAGAIHEALADVFQESDAAAWRHTLVVALSGSVVAHPLARRLLGGLEPEWTRRVLEIPSLTELRTICAERIRVQQADGSVRSDVDAAAMGNGIVAILLSLLMSLIQLGPGTAGPYADDIARVFEAALATPPPVDR